MTKPFQGMTQECLRQFVADNRLDSKKPAAFAKRNAICDFFGLNHETGHSWFGNFALPVGERLLRLRFFLETLGYQPSENQGLPRPVKLLGEYIAIWSIRLKEEAAFLVGTAPDTLLSVLLGKEGVSERRLQVIADIVSTNQDAAEQFQKKWHEKISDLALVRRAITAASPTDTETKPANVNAAIESLAHLILAAKPLAEALLSDQYSPEDRKRLRELTGNGRSNAVFDLSNLLNRLCGERARNEL